MRHPSLPTLLACAVLALAGCQKAVDVAMERAGGEPVERVAGGGGAPALRDGHSVALPADFPDDLFLPGEYGITSVMDMGRARIVNMTAVGTMAPLFESTRAGMRGHGWQQTLAVQQSDSAMLGFEKGGREVAYSFSPAGEDGRVTMGLQVLDDRQ
jgi:hypothetical protein